MLRTPITGTTSTARRVDLDDVWLLMQVIEHGSYSAAARALGIPTSTISNRIIGLECAAGTGLLRRTTRAFSLTEVGARLLSHASDIDGLVRRVEASLQDQAMELQGTLRVACCSTIAQIALSPIVPQFLAQHHKVAIRMEVSHHHVNLIGEGYDLALWGHVGMLKDSTLLQRVIAHTPWVLVASPRWVAAYGHPANPDDIPSSEVLGIARASVDSGWTLTRGEDVHLVQATPRLMCNDVMSLQASAVAGGGIACLPAYLVRAAFDAGELVRLLPDWTCASSTISVLTPPKTQSSRLARTFSDYLAAELPGSMQE